VAVHSLTRTFEHLWGSATKLLAYGDGVQRFATFLRLSFPRVRCPTLGQPPACP
jgi:hypothetical protein